MKRKLFNLSEELSEAIEEAKPKGVTLSAAIERWLWGVDAIKQAARRASIVIAPDRATRGRPPKQATGKGS